MFLLMGILFFNISYIFYSLHPFRVSNDFHFYFLVFMLNFPFVVNGFYVEHWIFNIQVSFQEPSNGKEYTNSKTFLLNGER